MEERTVRETIICAVILLVSMGSIIILGIV